MAQQHNFMDKIEKTKVIRCEWLNEDPLYIDYHDKEWGKPEHDTFRLFEMLCLEGQQAGLSWLTILKKRENYRNHFYNFIPDRIITLTDTDLEIILRDPGIVRHKGKIRAIKNNAECYIEMEHGGVNFSDFIWGFVDNKPIINHWKYNKEIPSETTISKAMSKALKAKGFKFVGPTICYAFMQACGLVDDHIKDCAYKL